MKNCDMTRDLLPLYEDSSCSEDSRKFVEAHLAECEACRAIHEAAGKTVRIILSRQKVKESFDTFRRRARIKRILLITACVLVGLILMSAVLYWSVDRFLYDPVTARIEPFEAKVSRLSDGSLHIALEYTEEDVYIINANVYEHPDEENTLCIEFGHSRINDMDPDLKNDGTRHNFLVLTDESAPLYDLKETPWDQYTHSYDKVILTGTDGERVLWQKGDEIPAADEFGERMLQSDLEGGWLIPIETAQPTELPDTPAP